MRGSFRLTQPEKLCQSTFSPVTLGSSPLTGTGIPLLASIRHTSASIIQMVTFPTTADTGPIGAGIPGTYTTPPSVVALVSIQISAWYFKDNCLTSSLSSSGYLASPLHGLGRLTRKILFSLTKSIKSAKNLQAISIKFLRCFHRSIIKVKDYIILPEKV